jgi:hypothetical protein
MYTIDLSLQKHAEPVPTPTKFGMKCITTKAIHDVPQNKGHGFPKPERRNSEGKTHPNTTMTGMADVTL